MPDRPAKKAGVTLVEDFLYPVIVDVPSPLAHLASARGAGGYLFGQRLLTGLTQLHRLFPEIIFISDGRGVWIN
jgi:hypothetical protein